jgi:hypothetical protein
MSQFGMHRLICLLLFVACCRSDVLLNGIYSVLDGKEFVYQLPQGKIEGVVILAHGCAHSSTDWWPKTDTCEKCIGLPIEKTIVKESLNRNILPIAISSSDRRHKCWMPHDRVYVSKIMNHFYSSVLKIDDLNHYPIYMLGASSGGSFVGLYGTAHHHTGMNFTALCIQISSLYAQKIDSSPPIIFVHMMKDKRTSSDISEMREKLKQRNVDTYEIHCHPKKLYSSFFYDHGIVEML